MEFTFHAEIDNRIEDKTWGHHFFVPSDVLAQLLASKHKRIMCTLNDLVEYNCALMPRGEGEYFVNVNQEICKKLRLEVGSIVSVVLKPDTSEYGMPLPEELVELFAHDKEFNDLFHSLTLGKQRNLIYLIAKPKSADTREKKAIVIVNHLKNRKGQLDFKILNQDFKDYNELLKDR